MKIKSLNIGAKQTVLWKGKQVHTGIFKSPVKGSLYLDIEDVQGDSVVDRRYHGGTDKACYIFSSDHYAYWQAIYPKLEWNFGMFGENITVEGLDESTFCIGDTFRLGETIIQVSEPRQPCMKLNARFESSLMVKRFTAHERCGSYLRVLQPGHVHVGDPFELIQKGNPALSVQAVFKLIYKKGDDALISVALEDPFLAESTKDAIRF